MSDSKPFVGDLTGIGKLADSEVANKVYDDALSPLMRQLGEFGEDVVKVGRLLLFPVQLAAAGQDRFGRWVERIAAAVPEERRQEAPPEITMPVLRALSYLPEDNLLADMYVELLTRAVDRKRAGEAHPAFIRIIEQLAPDEVRILERLRRSSIHLQGHTFDHETVAIENISSVYSLSATDLVQIGVQHRRVAPVYLDHLQSLGLVYLDRPKKLTLTKWGYNFVFACVPPKSESPAAGT